MRIVLKPHAFDHGFTAEQIYGALNDRNKRQFPVARQNRAGARYQNRENKFKVFAQDKPNGPYLHIVYEVFSDRIEVFHCREMERREIDVYQGKKGDAKR